MECILQIIFREWLVLTALHHNKQLILTSTIIQHICRKHFIDMFCIFSNGPVHEVRSFINIDWEMLVCKYYVFHMLLYYTLIVLQIDV